MGDEAARAWVAEREAAMIEEVIAWSSINSGTFHVAGIHRLGETLALRFGELAERSERLELSPLEAIDDSGHATTRPLADLWRFRTRAEANKQILLAVHLDTVFPEDHPFQRVSAPTRDDAEHAGRPILRGPGVCDAKGGIAVLATALEAFERFRPDDETGWTVVLNPDEEIGSPGSAAILAREARRAQLGLVFEPALPDGAIVSARKGSGNFTLVARGTSAHVGRAFSEGRSAIHALADLTVRVTEWNREPGLIANVGFVRGGGAVNVVSDLALARINVRVAERGGPEWVEERLAGLCAAIEAEHGVSIAIHGGFLSPPKLLGPAEQRLLESLRDCARDLGFDLDWRETGGVCDGNKLAAAGLPTLDTLGPVGGGLHSDAEFLDLDSLVPRAQLVALYMLRYARGAWALPEPVGAAGSAS